jgi:hypothetical protein
MAQVTGIQVFIVLFCKFFLVLLGFWTQGLHPTLFCFSHGLFFFWLRQVWMGSSCLCLLHNWIKDVPTLPDFFCWDGISPTFSPGWPYPTLFLSSNTYLTLKYIFYIYLLISPTRIEHLLGLGFKCFIYCNIPSIWNTFVEWMKNVHKCQHKKGI